MELRKSDREGATRIFFLRPGTNVMSRFINGESFVITEGTPVRCKNSGNRIVTVYLNKKVRATAGRTLKPGWYRVNRRDLINN